MEGSRRFTTDPLTINQMSAPNTSDTNHLRLTVCQMCAKLSQVSSWRCQVPRRAGQIVPRGESRWLVRVFLGRDATGGRRYHNQTVHGTKKDAQKYLTKAQRDLDLGQFVEPSDRPLEGFLSEWLAGSVAARVTPRTADAYSALIRLHINPVLGNRKLSLLTSADIQKLYAGMTERGLSPRTVRYTHAVLSMALDQAVKWSFLAKNPAKAVDLPRNRPQEMRFFTREQATAFLTAAESDRWHVLWHLLLVTGMRPGEALALKWSDLDGQRVRIQRNLVRSPDGRWVLKEPKTQRGIRAVAVPAATTDLLQRHRRHQLEERLKAGPGYEDRGFVFAATNGNPLDWHVLVQRHFNAIIKAAGLPRIRPYDLRHTTATLLLAAGENIKVVSERLGHANAAMTLNVYSHVLPDMQEAAAGRMAESLSLETG